MNNSCHFCAHNIHLDGIWMEIAERSRGCGVCRKNTADACTRPMWSCRSSPHAWLSAVSLFEHLLYVMRQLLSNVLLWSPVVALTARSRGRSNSFGHIRISRHIENIRETGAGDPKGASRLSNFWVLFGFRDASLALAQTANCAPRALTQS